MAMFRESLAADKRKEEDEAKLQQQQQQKKKNGKGAGKDQGKGADAPSSSSSSSSSAAAGGAAPALPPVGGPLPSPLALEAEARRATQLATTVSGVTKVVKVFEIITPEELLRLRAKADGTR